jgi:glycosyltransferase involved in cell wall biosynthesis
MSERPRVGIMLRHVTAPGGVTVFTKRVVRYLLTHPDGVDYHLLYSDEAQHAVFADLAATHVVLKDSARLRWDQVRVPRYAEANGLSLIMNCKFAVPLATRVPTLVVIPGRENLAMGHLFPWYDRWYNRLLVPAFCSRATALITHTEVGRDDCLMMGTRPEAIHIVPHGVDPYLRPASDAAKAALRRKLGLERPYILFLGGIAPLKNMANLLRAFALLSRNRNIDLVLAGFKRFGFQKDLELIPQLGLQERVKFVGYVPDQELAALYSGAECFTLPSWYEGFGIPIVEAMACGCPVVTSSGRHACPEVSGGAAVLVEPSDPSAIAEGIERVLDDPALRAEMIKKGFVQAAKFDWETTGRLTAEVIHGLIRRPIRPSGSLQRAATAVLRASVSGTAAVTELVSSDFYEK